MRRALLLAALVAAALGASPGTASATNECDGLDVCVPVAGPWVVIPLGGGGSQPPRAEYQVSCPRGYTAAGLDAELSSRAIDVAFVGRMGSPVNPGISTSRAVVFVGTYVGATARAPSFRPHVGCMPTSGGGARPRTLRRPQAVSAVFPPGEPLVRRVKTQRIRPGAQTVAQSCARAERLVGWTHAVGFYTRQPPTASLVANVRATERRAGRRIAAAVRADAELGGVRTVVQVQALCTRAR